MLAPTLRLGKPVRRRYLLRDTFSRADGALGTAEVGGAWGGGVSSWTISSGKAVQGDTTNNNATLDAGYSGSVEFGVRMTTGRATSNGSGLWLRANADGGNRIALHYESDGVTNSWVLYRVVSGAFTSIGSYSPSLAAIGYTWALNIRLRGSLIVVNIDGTDRISVTESTHQSQTIYAIRKASAGDSACAFDDFYVVTA